MTRYLERRSKAYSKIYSKEDLEVLEEMHAAADEDKKSILRELEEAGCTSPYAFDAWTVAHFGGLCLERIVRNNGNELVCDDSNLSHYLDVCIDDGLISVVGHYWMPAAGKAPEIVNLNFKEKAREWLLSEIYKRASESKEFDFLECVSVRKSYDNFVIRREERHKTY